MTKYQLEHLYLRLTPRCRYWQPARQLGAVAENRGFERVWTDSLNRIGALRTAKSTSLLVPASRIFQQRRKTTVASWISTSPNCLKFIDIICWAVLISSRG